MTGWLRPRPLRRLWRWLANRVIHSDAVASRLPLAETPTGYLPTGHTGVITRPADLGPRSLPTLRDRRGRGTR